MALVFSRVKDKKNLHNMHHFEKKKILYLAKGIKPNIKIDDIQEVLEQYREYKFIDPAP